jgi:Sec-independent protein translocase protein TatA
MAQAGKDGAVDTGAHIAHAFGEAVRAFRDALQRPMPERSSSFTESGMTAAQKAASPEAEKKSRRTMHDLEPAL